MPSKLQFRPMMAFAITGALLMAKCNSSSIKMALFTTITSAISVYIFWSSWVYPFYLSPLRSVPTVPGFPLWGQFFTIITSECGEPHREWHEKYGPIVRYFLLFGSERLSVAGDEPIKQLTIHNPYNYRKPLRVKLWMIDYLGEGILLSEGHTHVLQRKALSPAFSTGSVRALTPIFWAKSLHLAQHWKSQTRNGSNQNIEVLEWLNRTTLDIIGKAGLGTEINSLDHPDTALRQAYKLLFTFDVTSRILHGLTSYNTCAKWIPSMRNYDMFVSRKIISTMASEIVQEKLFRSQDGTGAQQKDIISLIVNGNADLTEAEQLSFEGMKSQVMTFLGAGHDTSAVAVAWCLHLLAKHPQLQKDLRDEIRKYLPFLFDDTVRSDVDSWAETDIDRLPLLDDICRESLRFIPAIPMIVRQSIEDDMLGCYFVPAGTTVYILANAINRLSTFWGPTANQFDPSRWRNLPDTFTSSGFMTFLQGPRGCIGRKFAETEMKILLCSVLSKFTFESNQNVQDPEELKMWRLVLRPRDGISLKVAPLA